MATKPAPKPVDKPKPKPPDPPKPAPVSAGQYAGVEAVATRGSAPTSASPAAIVTVAPPVIHSGGAAKKATKATVSAGEYAGVEAVATKGTPPPEVSPIEPPPPPEPEPGDGHKDASAASAVGGADTINEGQLTGGDSSQEIELLREAVGDLQFGPSWQAANPPKVAGNFGVALQGVEAGNNLRLAGTKFMYGCGKLPVTSGKIVDLVNTHQTPTFEVKK